MRKEYTASEALLKAESFCSTAERCIHDVKAKLDLWGIPKQEQEEIIDKLCGERYIDEARYCRAFVRDKYRFNQWGRVKISQNLRMKQIASEVINESLVEIDDEQYLEILKAILKQKKRIVKAQKSYEEIGKLTRFALGKGYEMKAIQQCLKEINADYELLD